MGAVRRLKLWFNNNFIFITYWVVIAPDNLQLLKTILQVYHERPGAVGLMVGYVLIILLRWWNSLL